MNVITARLAGAVVVGLGLFAGTASAEIDKLATYAQMRAIAAEQEALRGNTAEQGRYTQLQSQFDALQASMGGDDPTRMYEAASAPAATVAKAVRAAPPAPPGMIIGTTTATNGTPLVVPTGPGVVTSTLNVSGAGTYLWDLDVTTNLQHSFSADLDVTIQSPAGTVVTLTTDNAVGNDNVFDGTVWDDQGGTPASDFVYVNLTPATPLVPEEALGAFRGEDPNGTWTITISDDLAGDGGTLNAWTLDVFTLPTAPINTTVTFSNTTSTPLADVATTTSTITVSGAGMALTALDLTTALRHTFSADMDVTLTSPAGTVVTLTTDNGVGNDNVFDGTNWDDDANPAGQVPYVTNNGVVSDHAYVNLTAATPLVVEEALSAFMGQDPNGVWTLSMTDDLAGDTGTLNSWSLDVTTGVGGCTTLTCPTNVTVGNAAGTCGALVNYPAPTADAACGTVTCVAASGSNFGVGTNTVTCTTAVGGLSCNFSVTVNDTEAPVVTCPADIALDQIPGQPTLPVAYPPPTVSDNCPGATAACNPASGSPYSVGTTATTCTATDAAANTAACVFTVTVGAFIPNTPIPSLSLAGVLLLALLVSGLAFPGRR